jgi:hypothetical protein
MPHRDRPRAELQPAQSFKSTYEGCVLEGGTFQRLRLPDDWVLQRLVTVSGPERLPR